MARQFLKIVKAQKIFATDSQLQSYINSLAKKLSDQVRGYTGNYQFYILDDPIVNAFAGPGAIFFINTGLIDLANTEGELASVLAHEIAHHSQHHLAQLFEKQKATQIPALIAIIAGLAAGSSDGVTASAAVIAAQTELIIDYTNVLEREADVIGLQILTDAGYDARNLSNFLKGLESWLRKSGARQRTIHNTHPVTPERIAYVENRAKNFKNTLERENSAEFFLAKARTNAIYNWKPEKTAELFKTSLESGKVEQQSANRYGYALSLMKDRDFNQARSEIEQLMLAEPRNKWYLLAAAEIELAADNPEKAERLLANASEWLRSSLALIELQTTALLRLDRAKEAQKFIRKQIIKHPNSAAFYKLHAQASSAANDRLDSHLSLSEYHFLLGNLRESLNQLRIAEQYTADDFYTIETIKEKIRQVKQEIEWRS